MILSNVKHLFVSIGLIYGTTVDIRASEIMGQLLDWRMEKFNSVPTDQEKYDIIKQPLNRQYVKELKNLTGVDESKLFEIDMENKYYEKTNILCLAICLGNVKRVQQMLAIVPDVNSRELACWAHRQEYTLCHLAIDPRYPQYFSTIPDGNRLKIIDLLGKKEADFNLVHRHKGVFEYPPLAAGLWDGRYPTESTRHQQARALLYGAGSLFDEKPRFSASSTFFYDLTKEHPGVYNHLSSPYHDLESTTMVFLFEDYSELRDMGAPLKPTELVKVKLREVREHKIKFFQEGINTLQKMRI